MDDATISSFWVAVGALCLAALTPLVLKLAYDCNWAGVVFLCQYGYKWIMVGFVALGLLASFLSNIFAIVYLSCEHWDIGLEIAVFVYFIIGILITIASIIGLVYLISW